MLSFYNTMSEHANIHFHPTCLTTTKCVHKHISLKIHLIDKYLERTLQRNIKHMYYVQHTLSTVFWRIKRDGCYPTMNQGLQNTTPVTKENNKEEGRIF